MLDTAAAPVPPSTVWPLPALLPTAPGGEGRPQVPPSHPAPSTFQPRRAPRAPAPGTMERLLTPPSPGPAALCPLSSSSAAGVPLGPSFLLPISSSSGNGITRLNARPPSVLRPPGGPERGQHTKEITLRFSSQSHTKFRNHPACLWPQAVPLFLPRGPQQTPVPTWRPGPVALSPSSSAQAPALPTHALCGLRRATTGAHPGPPRAHQAPSFRKILGVCLRAALRDPPCSLGPRTALQPLQPREQAAASQP